MYHCTFARLAGVSAASRLGARAARRLCLFGLAAVGCGLLAGPALAQSAPSLSLLAGNGVYAPAVPGAAANSPLGDVEGMGADGYGNVYITDNLSNEIDKISPDGTLSVIAGTGASGAPTPGPALSSDLGYLYALTVDPAGDVFVFDDSNFQILKIDAAGTLSIVAGGSSGTPVAGPATSSPLGLTETLGSDPAGNVYYQDINDGTLWKITPAGVLSKIAGNGALGTEVAGDALQSPLGIGYGGFAGDRAGNVYFGDQYSRLVLKITPAGTLSIIAGNLGLGAPVPGVATNSPLGNIYGVAVDSAGNVYAGDGVYDYVVKITPAGALSIFAGDGTNNWPVDGPPTSSPLSFPFSLAVDGGDVLSVFTANRIVRIGPSEPSPPRNVVITAASASAALSFTPPGNPGTTPITGYEVSTDNGASWHAITTAAGSGQTLTATLAGLTAGTAYPVLVRAVNLSGAGDPSALATVTLPLPVLPAPPAAPLAPLAASPTAASPFMVLVQFRVPASCRQPCKLKAQLFLRKGKTKLGIRTGLTISSTGQVRFLVPVEKAALLAAGGKVDAKGNRTTLTRLAVLIRDTAGRWVRVVRDGHVTVSVGRLASGKAPKVSGTVY